MWGGCVWAEDPTASGPPPYLYVLSVFQQLVNDPSLPRNFILDGEGWDGASVVPIRFGRGQRFTDRVYHRGLLDAVNYETDLFAGSSGVGGASVPTLGDIGIAIGDGEHDELMGYSVDGRAMVVKMGGDGFTLTDYQPVFVGVAEAATWNLLRYSITLRDPSAVLQKPVQANLYAGDGSPTGIEGASDLKGKPKPLAFGRVFNATPEVVNQTLLIFQFHDGLVQSFDEIRDRGVVLTNAGDLTLAGLLAWTPVAASYVTHKTLGLIRLGALPAGDITGDLHGEATGGYVSTIAEIMQRVLVQRAGLSTAALDLAGFAALATDQPAEAGIYIAGVSRAVPEVLDELLEGILGFRTFTRDGLITVGRVAFGDIIATITESDVISIEHVRADLPYWRRKIGFARSYTVQGPNEIASGATDAAKSFAAEEYRVTNDATGEAASVLTAHPLAREVTVNSCLALEADAEAEAARQLALFDEDAERYDVVVQNHQFRRQPGQTVTLIYPRFGLDLGREFIILGIGENTSTGRTSLRLWR